MKFLAIRLRQDKLKISKLYITTIKSEIGFTADNLFKITNNTIISSLALILSYSVLLIQTSIDN